MDENKLIVSATLAELVVAIQQGFGVTGPSVNNGAQPQQQVPKHYVYGLKGLMTLLNVSYSTASRLNRSGILIPATKRTGRILIFDADMVFDLLSVDKRRRRIN